MAVKADGTIWRWGEVNFLPRKHGAEFEILTRPQKWLAFPGQQRPVSISCDGYGVAAVCEDGSLWVGGLLPYRFLPQQTAEPAGTEMVRYGEESDWKHVELLGTLAGVGIKRDGSLWTWESGWVSWRRNTWRPPLVPLSDYSVWTSVCCYGRAFLALGRDGSLCLWGDPGAGPYLDRTGQDRQRLLLPSRIHAVEVADLSRR